jgi:hypothetical protein
MAALLPFSSDSGMEAGSGLPTAALLLLPADAERGGHGSPGGDGVQRLQSQAWIWAFSFFHFFIRFTVAGMEPPRKMSHLP